MSENIINRQDEQLDLAQSRDLPKPPTAVRDVSQEIPTLPSVVGTEPMGTGVPIPVQPAEQQPPFLPEEGPAPDPIQAAGQLTQFESITPTEVVQTPEPSGLQQSDVGGPLDPFRPIDLPSVNFAMPTPPTVIQFNGAQTGELLQEIVDNQATFDSIDDLEYTLPRAFEQYIPRPTVSNYNTAIQNWLGRYREETSPVRETRQAYANLSPVGANTQGVSGFTRNVLSGRPLHPVTEEALQQDLQRIASTEPTHPIAKLRSFFEPGYRLGGALSDFIRFNSNRQLQRLNEEGLESYNDAIQRRNAGIVRNIAAGIASVPLLPARITGGERGRRVYDDLLDVIGGFDGVRGGVVPAGSGVQAFGANLPAPVQNVNPSFMDFYNSSANFREVISSLEPPKDNNGQAIFNPYRGYWGEFGNAGGLSAMLYLANLPEATVTGALYDITDFVRGGLAAIPNSPFKMPDYTRSGIGPALRGRDMAFMQRFDEGNYLSFVGNPALSWLPAQGQWYLGFLADMALGSLADAPIDAAISGARVARRAASELGTDALQSAARRIEGVQEPIETVVRRANSTSALPIPEGGFFDIEDYIPRIPPSVSREAATDLEPATNLLRQINELELPSTASIDANLAQSADNVVRTIHEAMSEPGFPYRSFSSNLIDDAVQRGTLRLGPGGYIAGTDEVVDAIIPPVNSKVFLPTFNRYSEAFELYRKDPLTLPASSYDLVRRTDAELEMIARRFGIEEPDAEFLNNFRIFTNSEEFPNIVARWGRPVPDEAMAPMVRMEIQTPTLPPVSYVSDNVVPIRPDIYIKEPPKVSLATPSSTPKLRAVADPDSLEFTFQQFDDFVSQRPYLTEAEKVIDLNVRRQVKQQVDADLAPIREIVDTTTNENVVPLRPTRQSIENRREINRSIARVERENTRFRGNIEPGTVTPFGKFTGRRQSVRGAEVLEFDTGKGKRKLIMEDKVREALAQPDSTILRKARKRLTTLQNRLRKYIDKPDSKIAVKARAEVERIYNDFPVLRRQDLKNNLEPSLAPSDELVDAQVVAKQEAITAGKLRDELRQVERIVQEQQKVLEELPPLERRPVIPETVTRSNYGDTSVRDSSIARSKSKTTVGPRNWTALQKSADGESLTPTQAKFVERYKEELSSLNSVLSEVQLADLRKAIDSELENSPLPFAQFTELRQHSLLSSLSRAEQDKVFSDLVANQNYKYVELTIDEVQKKARVNSIPTGGGYIAVGLEPVRAQAVAIVEDSLPSLRRAALLADDADGLIKVQDINANFTDDTLAEMAERYGDVNLIRGKDGTIEGINFVNQEDYIPVPTLFHGTKTNFSPLESPTSTSLTNELGIGTYLTNSQDEAFRYARAMPAKDRVDLAPTVSRFTERGRVYPVEIPPWASVLDVNESVPEWRGIVRESITDPDIDKRFRSWSSPGKKKEGASFLHYVRSQYIKKFGEDGYAQEYMRFLRNLQENTPYPVLKYGDTYNVVDPGMLRLGKAIEDTEAEGSILEGQIHRYAVDLETHGKLNNATTNAIVEDSRLDVDVSLRQTLQEAVGEQEKINLESTIISNTEELDAYSNRLDELKQQLEELNSDFVRFKNSDNNIFKEGDCW